MLSDELDRWQASEATRPSAASSTCSGEELRGPVRRPDERAGAPTADGRRHPRARGRHGAPRTRAVRRTGQGLAAAALVPARARGRRQTPGLRRAAHPANPLARALLAPARRFLFDHRVSKLVFGVLVIVGAAVAFVAPPFSGLDTLPRGSRPDLDRSVAGGRGDRGGRRRRRGRRHRAGLRAGASGDPWHRTARLTLPGLARARWVARAWLRPARPPPPSTSRMWPSASARRERSRVSTSRWRRRLSSDCLAERGEEDHARSGARDPAGAGRRGRRSSGSTCCMRRPPSATCSGSPGSLPRSTRSSAGARTCRCSVACSTSPASTPGGGRPSCWSASNSPTLPTARRTYSGGMRRRARPRVEPAHAADPVSRRADHRARSA